MSGQNESDEYRDEQEDIQEGKTLGKNSQSNTFKIVVWFVVSTTLLVIYWIQTGGGFKVQHAVWLAAIFFGCGALYFNLVKGVMFNILLCLVGSSAGMVFSNAKIGI
jgi:hypothetical protein